MPDKCPSATAPNRGTMAGTGKHPATAVDKRPAPYLPEVDETLPFEERERRRAVLADIARRIEENGPRIATPDDDRASQFSPFAALTGFEDLLREEQCRAAEMP